VRKCFWQRLSQLGLAGVAYAGTALVPGASAARPPLAPSSVFSSAESCSAIVSSGGRLARAASTARFASWNLHWFPDGEPGQSSSGADLAWLACTLAWLDADVIAVQELKQTPRARQALSDMLAELNRLSAGRYTARVDDCGNRVPQHVGLIWRAARVTARDVRTLGELNPSGEACGRQLRPGLAARLAFPGGLDLTAVSVHFKSMPDERALDLRETSFAALPGVLRDVQRRSQDDDLLVLGDMNTMGCEDCQPPLSSLDELSAADGDLRKNGLRFVGADAPGSHFHAGGPALLDHAVASLGMRELPPQQLTHVAGRCAEPRAASRRHAKQLKRRLSDHCPIVLDIADRDLD
jgi:endonuclease/exonuclease/phosphatase family metal-dependent hydrolase